MSDGWIKTCNADDIEPESFDHLEPSGQKIPEMEKNWFDCIRSGQAPYGNIDLAVRVQTVISLAEMSLRHPRVVRPARPAGGGSDTP